METNERKKYLSGHRKRLKEKFIETNFDSWKDYEILEFALTFALPRRDTKNTAKKLLEKFGTLKDLLQTDYKDFMKTEGIGHHAAVFLIFLKAFAVKYSELDLKNKEKISSPDDAVKFLQNKIGSSKNENFSVIFLNAANKILDYQIISEGVVNKSAVYPRKIAESALKNNATAVIISHNHPGGTCKPSQNDIISTDAVVKALKTIDIFLLDHIIVTSNNYYSFKDNGLI